MEKAIKLTPIEDDGVVYTVTPKGNFLVWLLDNKERLDTVLSGDDVTNQFCELWPEIASIFGLDDAGYKT